MSYTGFVCQIKNLREHPNGDKLYLGECFGNTVCVSRSGYTDGMTGVYFPTDGQLSVEFATNNNLLRLRDENGHSIPGGGYMDPDKRNVTAIKLRGEKSDGLFLPLSCLDYCFDNGAAANLNLGDTISVVNGHEICCKYIPRQQHRRGGYSEGNKTRKKKVDVAPLFMEHVDTEQLAYNLNAFKSGDEIEITLKMHGTSQRTAYLPVLKGYKRTLMDKLFRREGTPVYEYDLVTGTPRTVIENTDGGYYGNNEFRMPHAEQFRGKLWKGETVYYEVVGFTDTGVPIMSPAANSKMNDKEFVKQYGETTVFSYGCEPTGEHIAHGYDEDGQYSIATKVPQSDIYVYRITMTNEDGNVVEYTPDFMRYRCEQMGVKTVPVMARGRIAEKSGGFIVYNDSGVDYLSYISDDETAGEGVKRVAEWFYDGPDPIGKTHVREGVVVRIINRPTFRAYKHKNFFFKVLEGIIKDTAEVPDLEEAQEVE
jgi:hypothetical protein